VVVKAYGCLCEAEIFDIKGEHADTGDFGSHHDHDHDNAEPYGCGDNRFDGKPSTKEVLEKYGITEGEYDEIVSELERKLSFGKCGWCV
jgi:hypothetical protein